MTIRRRLTLWYASLLTAIIVIFGTLMFGVMRYMMINDIDRTLRDYAFQIALDSPLVQVPTFGAPPGVEVELSTLEDFRASSIYVQAWEIHADGSHELMDSSANVSAHTDPLDAQSVGWRKDHFSNVNIAGNDLRVLTRPIFLGDRMVGSIQIAGSLETVNKVSDTLLLLMVISCAIGMVGAGLISMWFSHRALKPIEDITRVTARIADTSELSTRLYWKGPPDELGRLISVFNKMMGRIEHAFNVQRRFVADMSHELRTPLTTIRGNLELGKRYGLDADAMAAMEIETERMSRLVSDLLMLARADYGGITIDLQPMDLELAVKLAVEDSRALTIGRELDLSLESTVPARIKGNAERLKEVLRGLIGNAVKFTPDGGFIHVRLTATEDHATIHVRDSGIGIESDHIDHIFDRFYQADSSRTHLGGFGLGLSIARWVVDAHGGSIEAESTPGDGATFRITLPLEKPEPDEAPYSSPTRPRLPIIRRTPRDGQDGGLHDLEIVTSGSDEDEEKRD